MPVYILNDDPRLFPDPCFAESDGLLAVGGDLTPERLIEAYSRGIFPWFSDDSPILWWSPDPRLVLFPRELKISRSLRQVIRRGQFDVTVDGAFREVMTTCGELRRGSVGAGGRTQAGDNAQGGGTWITLDMIEAYCKLHELGLAHSVECRRGGELVGGLYGVALGGAFFGESMFSTASNASKVALSALSAIALDLGFTFIDCQMTTKHLLSMGAVPVPREDFMEMLALAIKGVTYCGRWG
jgi:leucyl/phenylalanyl-tRNA--protein transferase